MPTSRPVRDKTIGGIRYQVTLLGAKAGRSMLVRLTKLLGPAMASFLDGMLHAKGDLTTSLAIGAGDAIREVTQRLTAADLEAISDELARFTVVVIDEQRQPQLDKIFDDHFAGKYNDMAAWLAFALEANFSSFFDDARSDSRPLAQRLQTWIALLSPSPNTSTGTSGGSSQASASPQA
jgi:hypothetical protein